ncbi:MAG: LPD38 domain-containing protein [bacterium]
MNDEELIGIIEAMESAGESAESIAEVVQQYESQVDLKKKEDSTSVAPQDQSVLEAKQEAGSSDSRGQLVKDIDSGKIPIDTTTIVEQEKEDISPLLERYENETSLTEEDEAEINLIQSEQSRGDFGFFGNLTNKIKTTPTINFMGIPTRNPLFNPNEVNTPETKEELTKKIKDRKTEEFIENLSEEEQGKLKNHFQVNTNELTAKTVKSLLDTERIEKDLKSTVDEILEIKANYDATKEYDKSYYQNNKELVDKAKQLQSEYENSIDLYNKNTEDLLSEKEELDLFRRNYGKLENFTSKLSLATVDLGLNLSFLLNKVNKANPFAIGADTVENAIVKEKALVDFRRELLRKGKSVGEINSVEDTFEWATDLVAEQTPNTVLLATTGGAGLPILGASAAGGKLADLEEEERITGVEYTDTQKALAAGGSFVFETLSERISLGQINKAKRLFTKVGSPALKDKTLNYLKREFPDYTKDLIQEGGSEALAQLAENISDKYLLGKDVSITEGLTDAFVSGAFMSGVVYKFPMLAKAFVPKDANQKIGENFIKLLEVSNALKDESISETSKQELTAKRNTLINDNQSLIENTFNGISKISSKDKGSLLAIENAVFKERKKAKEISEDKKLSESAKTQLLEDKKQSIQKLEAKKEAILKPKEVETETKETTQEVKEPEILPEETKEAEVEEVKEETPKVKTYQLGATDKAPVYNVSFNNGVLEVKDSKGNEPTSKTKRKVLDKYAEELDFTEGKSAVIPEGAEADANVISAKESENAAEIAALINDTSTKEFIENQLDFKTRVIAEGLGKIDKQSYIRFGDRNNIGVSKARTYFGKINKNTGKSEGTAIDVKAQELSETSGIEITPQDIVDHIDSFPNGKSEVYKSIKDAQIKPLQDRFTELTGLPANDKYIEMAVKQQIQKEELNKELESNYLNKLTEEELISLYNERESYERSEANTEANSSNEVGNDTTNTKDSQEESSVREGTDETIESTEQSEGELSESDKSFINKLDKKLSEWDNDLKKFGDETLGINIPIHVARTAIQVMRASIKAGKTANQIIKDGIDAIKNTKWYQSLSKSEKSEINESNLLNSIKETVDKNKSISKEEAREKHDKSFNKAKSLLEKPIKAKAYIRKSIREIIKRFSDRQFLSKKLVDGAQMSTVKNLMINSHGASGRASHIFKDAYNSIYKGLNNDKRERLDKIIQLRRFITIDNNRFKKGLPHVAHPDFIDLEQSKLVLESHREELGDKTFDDLNKRADAYFKVYSDLLKMIHKEGLINDKVYEDLNGLDYQPRLFLEHILDFEGKVSLGTAAKDRNETGGLSKDQINSLKEGSEGSLLGNSEWLLSTSIVSRLRSIAMNKINKEFAQKEYPKAKEKFESLNKDLKNKKKWSREDKRFYKYFKELDSLVIMEKKKQVPKGFLKAYYYDNGVQKEFYLAEPLHEQWFNNTQGFLSPGWREGISYFSGSALLKGIATGNNPAFIIVNTPRDFLFTSVFSPEYSNFWPKAAAQVLKDTLKSISEIAKSNSSKPNNLFQKYIEYGGDMAFLSTQGRLKSESLLAKAINKTVSPKSRDLFKTVFSGLTLRKLSTYSEIMFRMAIFQRSIKNELKSRGVDSIDSLDKETQDEIYNKAVANGRSILDFNQGGVITKDLESILPYVNTAVQGTRVAADTFMKNPATTTLKVLQSGAITSTAFIGASMLLISKNSDEEDKSWMEVYLDSLNEISPYQKQQYFIIPTGKKNENGNYKYFKVAKTHQLTPVFTFVESAIQNHMRSSLGREKRSNKDITSDVINAFNSNISPISLDSPAQNLTRNPALKAVLTYSTGYDFYRGQPLSNNIDNNLKPLEGQNMSNVEDFYKTIGKDYGLSPVRTKAAVESFITTPNTNPFIGFLYSGADYMSSDKDLKQASSEFVDNLSKSITKRFSGEGSDFMRSLNEKEKYKEQEQQLLIEEGFKSIEMKSLARGFAYDEITEEEYKKKLSEYDPSDKKKIIKKQREYKRLKNIVDRNILDIKYTQSSKLRALMIVNRYGNIFDGSEESKKVIKQMNRAKGVLTSSVKRELKKLIEESN